MRRYALSSSASSSTARMRRREKTRDGVVSAHRRARRRHHRGGGNAHAERRPLPRPAVDVHLAAQAAHDAERDRQAEPGAHPARLGREERLEDARRRLGRDARPVVRHLDDDVVAVVEAAHADQVALDVRLLQRLRRVRDQVQEHLSQPGGAGQHRPGRAQVLLDARAVLELVAQHRQRRFDRGVDADGNVDVLVGVRERSQIAHDALNARHPLLRLLEDGAGLEQQIRQPRARAGPRRAARAACPRSGACARSAPRCWPARTRPGC